MAAKRARLGTVKAEPRERKAWSNTRFCVLTFLEKKKISLDMVGATFIPFPLSCPVSKADYKAFERSPNLASRPVSPSPA